MSLSVQVQRGRLVRPAVIAVLLLAAVSWWVSVGRMQGMDAGPSVALGALGWFVATWILMMAAMMLPAIAPVLAAECFPAPRTVARRSGSPHRVLVAAAFLVGYFVVWTLAGAGAYLALRAGRAVAGGVFEWHRGGQWLAAATLVAAAAYQLTATKRRWLARCQEPLTRNDGVPISRPGPGVAAGVRAGVRCLASSWALMGVLFALGAMSLVWMAVVAVLISAERLSPLVSPARVTATGVLLLLALGVAFAPGAVPGLTVPGSSAAQRAMTRMGMPAGATQRQSMSMSGR